jgi:hypothetical protein
MICAACSGSFKTFAKFKAHRLGCRPKVDQHWAEHFKAREAGKLRKAGRIAREILGVERETAFMSEALKERLRNPAVRKASQDKARAKREALRSMKRGLAVAGSRRRRILA